MSPKLFPPNSLFWSQQPFALCENQGKINWATNIVQRMWTRASGYRACSPTGKNWQMSCSRVMPLTAPICQGPRDQELLVMKHAFRNMQLKYLKFILAENSHEFRTHHHHPYQHLSLDWTVTAILTSQLPAAVSSVILPSTLTLLFFFF